MDGHRNLGGETVEIGEPDPFTDDELAEMALAADVDAPLSGDAVPLSAMVGAGPPMHPLPSWYMPGSIRARRLTGWRGRLMRGSALSVVASFVAITAAGLCNTYGQLHF